MKPGRSPFNCRRSARLKSLIQSEPDTSKMLEELGRIRLIYIVLAVLLVVGLLPLGLAGTVLSRRSADELRSVEGRY